MYICTYCIGQHMFEKGIMGMLQGKTRIIVMNSHMHFLPRFDKIVVLDQVEDSNLDNNNNNNNNKDDGLDNIINNDNINMRGHRRSSVLRTTSHSKVCDI